MVLFTSMVSAAPVTKYDIGNQTHVLKIGPANVTEIQVMNNVEDGAFKSCDIVDCEVFVRIQSYVNYTLQGSDFDGYISNSLGEDVGAIFEGVYIQNNVTEQVSQPIYNYSQQEVWNSTTEQYENITISNISGYNNSTIEYTSYDTIEFPFDAVAGTDYILKFVFTRNASFNASDDVVFSILGYNFVEYAYWNSSFQNAQLVDVTNPLAGYEFRILVNTSGMISNATLQSDCDDLRFITLDNSTELNYWIETDLGNSLCNQEDTPVWVQTQGAEDFWMYYNNPTATAKSNGNTTFQMFDDFDDDVLGSIWGVFDDGSPIGVTEASNKLSVTSCGTCGGLVSANETSFPLNKTVIWKSKVLGDGTGEWSAVAWFGVDNDRNGNQSRFMGFSSTVHKTTTRVSGSETNTDITFSAGWDYNEINRLNSTWTSFIRNFTSIANHTANIFTTNGFPAIAVTSGSNVEADWVLVKNSTLNEPTYTFGPIISAPADNTPVISTIILQGNQSAGTFNPVENATRYFTFQANISDADGTSDIDDANLTCSWYSSPTSEAEETQVFNYTISVINATYKDFACSYPMRYYDDATSYQVNISANDDSGNFVNNSLSAIFSSLTAFSAKESTLNYGSGSVTTYLKPSTDLGIWNTGNQVINSNVSGTNMVNGVNTILIGNITWDTTFSAAQSAYSNILTTSSANYIQALNNGFGANGSAYFGLFLPSGSASGTYNGNITIELS